MNSATDAAESESCSPEYLKAYERHFAGIMDAAQTTARGGTLKERYPVIARLVKTMSVAPPNGALFMVRLTHEFCNAMRTALASHGGTPVEMKGRTEQLVSPFISTQFFVNKRHLEEIGSVLLAAQPKFAKIEKNRLVTACDYAVEKGWLAQDPMPEDDDYFAGEEVVWVTPAGLKKC